MANDFENNRPLLSIILPSWFTFSQHGKYGRHETFWFACKCLDRLLAVTPKESFELIIIDNGSEIDGSMELEDCDIDIENKIVDPFVKVENKIRVRYPMDYWEKADVLIKNINNLGFAKACNQGFNIARGKYICCINNDILVWPGWEKELINLLENKTLTPSVGIVMPALVKDLRDAKIAIISKEINLTQNAGKFGIHAEFGSCWMMKRELINKIKELNKNELGEDIFFDENFKAGMGEDRKIWAQVRQLNMETYRSHDTRVYHQGNMTIGKLENRKQYTEPNRAYLAEWKKKNNII